MQRLHHRVVVHPADDYCGGVTAVHVQRLGGVGEVKGDDEAVYFYGPGVGDVHNRGDGMGAVISGGNPVAPVVAAATARQFHFRWVGVDVLTLAVFEVADAALLVEPLHLLVEDHVGVVLGEHVDLAAFLDRPRQCHAFAQGVAGRGFAHYVFVGLECFDGKRRVLVEVVGQYDRVHVAAEEFVVIDECQHVEGLAFCHEALFPNVANGDQFHAGRRSRLHEGAAATDADYADADGTLFAAFFGHGLILCILWIGRLASRTERP